MLFCRWWSSETVAAVTGSNRGIGYEIARQLAVHGLHVIVTSRDSKHGREVVGSLREDGLSVDYCQLDVLNEVSIQTFTRWISEKYGGLDILVSSSLFFFTWTLLSKMAHLITAIDILKYS